MKVLSISTDRKILEQSSAVRTRMIEYGAKMGELHIVVFTQRVSSQQSAVSSKMGEVASPNPNYRLLTHDYQLSTNVWVYPTNSISRWMFVFDAIRLGKKIVVDHKFVRGNSVITCQDPFECGYVGWRIAKKFRLPLHLQIHTDFLSPYFKTSFFQRFRVFMGKFLLPKAQGIRVVSTRIADSIIQAHIKTQHPVQILPIRIDIETIEKAQTIDLRGQFPQFKFIILMASRLSKEKRIGDALVAFAKVCEKYSFAGLLIAGDGSEKNNLERMVQNLRIERNVVFLGFRNDISSLLKSSNVFLSTSEFEGYGMALIEAGLANCPIISTDVGVANTILKDGVNAFICPVGDKECFYSKIIQLMSDNSLRAIFTGRLQSDIRAHVPEKGAYVSEWVKGLEEIKTTI